MLRVVEIPKSQSRPEFFDNSAKLDSIKKEGNPMKNDFEPLVIARHTELIEKLLPRFDSSCKKLMGEKTDVKELYIYIFIYSQGGLGVFTIFFVTGKKIQNTFNFSRKQAADSC